MLLVPVLDIRHGQVVRAVRGERAAYRPVPSRLAAGSDPLTLAQALLDASGSDTLYVADLDALQGEPPQRAVLHALRAALPGIAFWLDGGFSDMAAARDLIASISNTTPVFGTESLRSRDALTDRKQAMLSLDHFRGAALDRLGLWDDPSGWPDRVIVMTLDRVGADAGPDLSLLSDLQRRAPATQFIGAGGIRDDADVAACAAAGAHAWLVASALHERRVGRAAGRPLATEAVA